MNFNNFMDIIEPIVKWYHETELTHKFCPINLSSTLKTVLVQFHYNCCSDNIPILYLEFEIRKEFANNRAFIIQWMLYCLQNPLQCISHECRNFLLSKKSMLNSWKLHCKGICNNRSVSQSLCLSLWSTLRSGEWRNAKTDTY